MGDSVGHGVALPQRPIDKPQQILVLLADTVILQPLLLSQVCDELIDAGFVEVFQSDILLESFHMMLECHETLLRGIGPLLDRSLLLYKFIQQLEERFLPGFLGGCRRRGFLFIQGLIQLLLELILGGAPGQLVVPVQEMVFYIVQASVDFCADDPPGLR